MRANRSSLYSPAFDLENHSLPQPRGRGTLQLESYLQGESRNPAELCLLLGRLVQDSSSFASGYKQQMSQALGQFSLSEWELCKGVISRLLTELGMLEQGALLLLNRFPACFFDRIHLWMPEDPLARYTLCRALMQKAPNDMLKALPDLGLSDGYLHELGLIAIKEFASLELLMQLPVAESSDLRDRWIDYLARYAHAKGQLHLLVEKLPALRPSSVRASVVIQSAINQGLRSMTVLAELPVLSKQHTYEIAMHLVKRGRYADLRQFKCLDQAQRLDLARAMFRNRCTWPSWVQHCGLEPENCKTIGLEILDSHIPGSAHCFLEHFFCMDLLHTTEYAEVIVRGVLFKLPFAELKAAYKKLEAYIPRFEHWLGSFLLAEHSELCADLLLYSSQKGVAENGLLKRNLLLWAVGLIRLGAEFPVSWHKMLLNWRDEPSRNYLSDVVAQKKWQAEDVKAISLVSKDYQLPALIALALPEADRSYFYTFLEAIKAQADFGTNSRTMLHLVKTLQIFCEWIVEFETESSSWHPVCDKLLEIAATCQQASRKLKAQAILPELFAMQILVLSESIEHANAPWRKPGETFRSQLMETLSRYVPATYPCEGLKEKYDATVGQWRRSESIFLLGSRLLDAEDERLREQFKVFVASVFDGDFAVCRRTTWLPKKFAAFKEDNAIVWESWTQYSCSEPQVVLTDDPCDLLLMGTEVERSCLSVAGDLPNLAGLLGNIMNANAKMLAVKAVDTGEVVARRVVRLGECEGVCALFLEKCYGQVEYDSLLLEAAKNFAARMDLKIYSTTVKDCETVASFKVHAGLVDYVYSDAAAFRVGEPTISRGEFVIPNVECFFSPD